MDFLETVENTIQYLFKSIGFHCLSYFNVKQKRPFHTIEKVCCNLKTNSNFNLHFYSHQCVFIPRGIPARADRTGPVVLDFINLWSIHSPKQVWHCRYLHL